MEAVSPYLREERREVNLDIELADSLIRFSPGNMFGNRLVHYRAGRLRARQRLEAWVSHLAANITEPGTESVFIFRGDDDQAETKHLGAMDDNEARHLLESMVQGYFEGITHPPFLPAEASFDYAEQFLKHGDQDRALFAARRNWDRSQPGSEGQDRYWQRLYRTPEAFDDTFAETALTLWQPIMERFTDG